jgi:hypothetical protein
MPGEDSWETFTRYCKPVVDTLTSLKEVTVGDRVLKIKWLVGGDMKFLSAIMAHAGQASNFPCPWCLIHKDDLAKHFMDLEESLRPLLRSRLDAER